MVDVNRNGYDLQPTQVAAIEEILRDKKVMELDENNSLSGPGAEAVLGVAGLSAGKRHDPRDRRRRTFLIVPAGATVPAGNRGCVIESVRMINSDDENNAVTISDGLETITVQANGTTGSITIQRPDYKVSRSATITTGPAVICLVQVVGSFTPAEPVATAYSRVLYFDPTKANNSGDGLSKENAKRDPLSTVTWQANDIALWKSGTTWNSPAQWAAGNVPSFIVGAYDSGSKPEWRFTVSNQNAIVAPHGVLFTGIKFNEFRATSGSPTGVAPHGILFQSIAGGATGTKGASGGVFNCDFSNMNGNAVYWDNGNPTSESAANANIPANRALGADMAAALQCTFADIGEDAFVAKVRGDCEFGFNIVERISQRSDAGDCFHILWHNPLFSWVHDNWLDHTNLDTKQCVLVDAPSGDTSGYSLVEQNVMLGFGTNAAPASIHHVCLIDTEGDFRRNYVESTGVALGFASPRGSATDNIFRIKKNQSGKSPIYFNGPGEFSNNIVFEEETQTSGSLSALNTVVQNASLPFRGVNNIFIGSFVAMRLKGDTLAVRDHNVFIDVTNPYVNNALASLPVSAHDVPNKTRSIFVDLPNSDFRLADLAMKTAGTFVEGATDLAGYPTPRGSRRVGPLEG